MHTTHTAGKPIHNNSGRSPVASQAQAASTARIQARARTALALATYQRVNTVARHTTDEAGVLHITQHTFGPEANRGRNAVGTASRKPAKSYTHRAKRQNTAARGSVPAMRHSNWDLV